MYVIKKTEQMKNLMCRRLLSRSTNLRPGFCTKFTDEELKFLCEVCTDQGRVLTQGGHHDSGDAHNIVEAHAEAVNPAVAKSYRDYRNYKMDFIHADG